MSLSSVENILYDALEAPFKSVGNIGPGADSLSPYKRGLGTAALAAAIMQVSKPSISFYSNGEPRPWALNSEEEGATLLPWWIAPTGAFVFFSFFI